MALTPWHEAWRPGAAELLRCLQSSRLLVQPQRRALAAQVLCLQVALPAHDRFLSLLCHSGFL